MLELEQQLIDEAAESSAAGLGVASAEQVEEALAHRPTIRDEQAAMVRRLTTSGAGVDVVAAAAGTGKTFGLDAARDAWQRSGYCVVGASLAAEAAHELQAAAGIPSDTIALLEHRLDRGDQVLDHRSVLVIDEAGMVGTRSLAHLLHYRTRESNTKVVLVGDPRQLPEIDAGGVLRGLSQRLDPISLTENRRQVAEWERVAVSQLRDGNVDDALDAYRTHGRIITSDTAPELRGCMLDHWWQTLEAGEDVRMLALRRSDVEDLNQRARAQLQATGRLQGPILHLAGRPFQAGDTVLCERNHRRLGIRNGTRGTVVSVDPEARTLTLRSTDERLIELPATYLNAGHLSHGYATTIHKSQGKTVDRTLTLATDELLRAHGYVAMSRGRLGNHLYAVTGPDLDLSTTHVPEVDPPEPFELVRQALWRDQPKQLAIDTGDPIALWTLERLTDERDRLQATFDACPADRTIELRSARARHARLQGELEPLAERFNQLSERRLRSPKVKAEMRRLSDEIAERTDGLRQTDLDVAELNTAMRQRDAYIERYQPEVTRWEAISGAIDDKVTGRAHRRERTVQALDGKPVRAASRGLDPADPDWPGPDPAPVPRRRPAGTPSPEPPDLGIGL